MILLSVSLRGDPRGTTVSYASGGGSALSLDSQGPQRYPTSARELRCLRATVVENSAHVQAHVSLRKNDEGTPLSFAIPADAELGSKHHAVLPVSFTDDEDFDVQLLLEACDGRMKLSISIE